MDKVKRFWQLVVKEREDFWSTFFKKYEDDSPVSDDDVRSYMDNSSSRIDTLLKIAEEESQEKLAEDEREVLRYTEEQSSDGAEPVQQEPPSSIEPANMNMTDVHVPHSPAVAEPSSAAVIRKPPEFITEIIAEDEEISKVQRTCSSAKKFKLFESPKLSGSSLIDANQTPTGVPPHESSIEGDQEHDDNGINDASTTSPFTPSVKYICRHVKRRSSKQVSAPKRFRLV